MSHDRVSAFLSERLWLAWLAGLAMWLVWAASVAIGGGTFDSTGELVGTDHMAFYSAARLVLEGNGPKVYDYEFLAQYQWSLVGHWFLDAFRNPPFYALLYVPTARLPYVASFWVWTAVSIAALWLGIRWLDASRPGRAFVWALSFYPVFAAISFGQNSLLSLALFGLTFRSLDRGKPFHAGLTAGFLLYKPQLVFVLGLWWLLDVRRYWKCLAGVAATGAVLLAICLLFLREETAAFVDRLGDIARYDAFYFYNLHTPRGFWALLFGDDKRIGTMLGAACSLIALAAFVWFWRKHRNAMPVMFAAAVLVTLWASPHTMIYDWSLALVPAVLLWERRPQLRDTWVVLFSVAWLALFVSTVLAKWQFDRIGGALQVSVPVLAALAVMGARRLSPRADARSDEAVTSS